MFVFCTVLPLRLPALLLAGGLAGWYLAGGRAVTAGGEKSAAQPARRPTVRARTPVPRLRPHAQEAAPEEGGSEEEDEYIYNPLKLPLGWDGKPIPYWLYKLHGWAGRGGGCGDGAGSLHGQPAAAHGRSRSERASAPAAKPVSPYWFGGP